MADTYLQVRTNANDKEAAAAILEELGTNLSAVVNMLLKQIIITQGIPFEISLNNTATKRISPYRTDDLRAILSVVPDSVEEIWVFGSTVTPYCRPQSDLDLCIIGNTSIEEESRIYKAAQCAVDIITETPEGFAEQKRIPGSIYKEVAEKGLLVYKKEKNIQWA